MVCEIATSGGREEAQEVSVQVEVGVFRVGSFELSGAGSALLGDCDACCRCLPPCLVPGSFPHGYLTGVAVRPDGAIVVSSDGDNSVRVFEASAE